MAFEKTFKNEHWWRALFVIALLPISFMAIVCVLVYRARRDIKYEYKLALDILTGREDATKW